jgi:hypothetical protein
MLAVARRIAGLTGIPAAWVLGLDDGPPDGGFDPIHPLDGVEKTAPKKNNGSLDYQIRTLVA